MANRVGVQVNVLARFDVGQMRVFVQEKDQGGPLAKLEAYRPATGEQPGRGDEVGGKGRAVGR
jgi:hypothetical protein